MARPLEGLDFEALGTLVMVAEAGSFSAAAARLELTQSTVSYRIDRLRRAFGDPLFVRDGAGVRLTERGVEAAAEAARLIEAAEAMLDGGRFDPATATGRFVIACNVYERALLIPPVVRRLRAAAPGMTLTVTPSLSVGAEVLRRGGADLLLSPRLPEHDVFDATPLLEDSYVVVMDAANPLASGQLGAAAYEAAAHVMIDYGGGWRSPYLDAASSEGLTLRPALVVPSPGELASLLVGTDLIATVPGRFAKTLDPVRLVMRPPPFQAGITLFAYSAPVARHSARTAWVRDAVAAAARKLAAR